MKWRLDHGQIEVVDEIMVPFLRVKTPAERIAMIAACNRTARELLKCNVMRGHPEWDDVQVQSEVARRMLRAAG
jgi:hypothetical protein